MARAEREGHLRGIETQLRRRDGRVFWARLNTFVELDGDGRPLFYVGAIEDVTERRLAEDALWESEARSRMLLEQLPAVLWTTDTELRSTLSEGAGLKSIGLRPNQLRGKKIAEYMGDTEEAASTLAAHRRALQGEVLSYRQDWGGRAFEAHVRPLYGEDRSIIGTLGMALDVTDRTRLEAVGRLAGGIAEDLSALLREILGDAEAARRIMRQDDPALPCLVAVRKAAYRASALVRELLAVSREHALVPDGPRLAGARPTQASPAAPMIFGPTFAEMRDPSLLPAELRAKARDARSRPLDPANLFNLSWKADGARAAHRAARGAHRRGRADRGAVRPPLPDRLPQGRSRLLDPGREAARRASARPASTRSSSPPPGNFGIGGAWVGPRMGYRSLVVLPEEMSAERFEKIRALRGRGGGHARARSRTSRRSTTRSRSCGARPRTAILNQFEEFGELPLPLPLHGGRRRRGGAAGWACGVGAFVSAMGSAGTIAAGEALEAAPPGRARSWRWSRCSARRSTTWASARTASRASATSTSPGSTTCGRPTCSCAWTTRSACEGLQLLQEGTETLVAEGVPAELARELARHVRRSAASATCWRRSRPRATTAWGRRRPWSRWPPTASTAIRRCCAGSTAERGPMTRGRGAPAPVDLPRPEGATGSWRARREVRRRWHNQKYFTWVEQQGKTVGRAARAGGPGVLGRAAGAGGGHRSRDPRRRRSDGAAPVVDHLDCMRCGRTLPPRARRALPALRAGGRARRRVRPRARRGAR